MVTESDGTRWFMAIYKPPNDQDYVAWRDTNPSGYVINVEPG